MTLEPVANRHPCVGGGRGSARSSPCSRTAEVRRETELECLAAAASTDGRRIDQHSGKAGIFRKKLKGRHAGEFLLPLFKTLEGVEDIPINIVTQHPFEQANIIERVKPYCQSRYEEAPFQHIRES